MQTRTTSKYDALVSHAGLHSSNVLRAGINDVANDFRQSISLPVGWRGRTCPSCGAGDLRGALISPSADEQDPDVVCASCNLYF
jgi:hypothetical protein